MKWRQRHQWGEQRVQENRGRLFMYDQTEIRFVRRCVVCRERWAVNSIVSNEAVGPNLSAIQMATRTLWPLEADGDAIPTSPFARLWCYPDLRVRAVVHMLRRLRSWWRRVRSVAAEQLAPEQEDE